MDSTFGKDKKIAVAGVGGVGGYLSAILARAYPHVTVVARGERGESIREQGIRLHSDHKGEIISRPERVVASARELESQDYIFICVKNYSLEEVCQEIRGAVREDTVVIPVMNGADVGERVRKLLGKGKVIESVIYIVAFANPDYSVTQQGDFASMRIGTMRKEDLEEVKSASDLLKGADIDHKVSQDIERDIWKKYILNCAYNVETAYYDNTIGELRSDPAKAKEYEQLVYEACRIAVACGVSIRPEDADGIIRRFYEEIADNATSSLQRDVRAGKKAEIDTFSGYLAREGRRLGIDVPVTEKMYEGLKEKEEA
ncbi:MAG TPA: 2-dehydropantoate 2-reductase [Candidatus Dorea gallistercoris]|uniref:2-dehydropantoate 2-reductase n=1 Tax=Candidatus Dorea gallistercoris TaxID=2838542 RepID=A0A9D1RAG1_9FIRM|nr:2-dehydropantoate 2-reductase [Candidatus Dorea gallistercoris]